MQRVIRGSVSLAACALLSVTTVGCDPAEPGDEELARELDDEEDEAQGPVGGLPVGSDELTAQSDPSAAANYFVPTGTHDLADCNLLTGWVKDGDTTLPSWVTIYRGAAFPYGQYVATAYANIYRSDLPFADKSHGFSIATPAAFKTGNDETVYIHGINIDVNGDWAAPGATNPLLNSTGKTICCGVCDNEDDDDGGPHPEDTF